jgi:hypothetical protein
MSPNTSESSLPFPKLDEDNYSSWVRNMKAQLQSKKVWMVVSGVHSKPSPTADNYMDWLEKEEVAAGMIYLALQDGQKAQIEAHQDDPKKMWEELEAIHVQKRPSTRFIAYNTLLSITKQDEESLPSLTSRIEKAMQDIKQLRPKAFTITDLDNDLVSMTMVRSLGPEYQSFVSSLVLLPQFDFKTVKEAFLNEELTRKASLNSPGVVAAANLAKLSQKGQKPFKSSSASSSPFPKPVCEFCNIQGHLQDTCRRYKASQAKARLDAQEAHSNRRQQPSNLSSPSNTQSPSISSAEHASVAQDSGNVAEFAGNASTTLSTSLTPHSSFSLH